MSLDVENEDKDMIDACIHWIHKGEQMANVLSILNSESMNSGEIKKSIHRKYQNNAITQRSVIRIINSFVRVGLAKEKPKYDIPGTCTWYVLTELGALVQKELERQRKNTGE